MLLTDDDHSLALQLSDKLNVRRCLSITCSLTLIFGQLNRHSLVGVIYEGKFCFLVRRGPFLKIISRECYTWPHIIEYMFGDFRAICNPRSNNMFSAVSVLESMIIGIS